MTKGETIMKKKNLREKCLRVANECVNGARNLIHGTPEDNFGLIADLWTDYLGHVVTKEDVTMMMVLLKVARVRSGAGDSDNFVDIAGYAACGFENYITIRDLEENRMQKKIEILEDDEADYEDSIIC